MLWFTHVYFLQSSIFIVQALDSVKVSIRFDVGIELYLLIILLIILEKTVTALIPRSFKYFSMMFVVELLVRIIYPW